MSGRGILDADMRTVGTWLVAGVRWWLDELSAMLPAGLRRGVRSRAPVIGYDPTDGFRAVLRDGTWAPHALAGRPSRPAAILLPRALCLTRLIDRPAMADRDLRQMIALDADRVMPLPAGEMIVAARVAGRDAAARRMAVAVAGLPIGQARRIGTALGGAGVQPARIVAEVPAAGGPIAVDLLPAMRAAGLVARARGAAPLWWAAVAFAFVLNIAIIIWRDAARTDALADTVAAQQPAVDAAHRIVARIGNARRSAEATLALRRTREPLAILGRVGRSLPPGAWVQRLTWQSDTLRIAGFRPSTADVAGGLRRIGGFADVRYAADQPAAAMAAGQPFEVTAWLGPPR